jgi:hypothetical protein
MAFYRKNWYYAGGILFVAIAFFVGFWGGRIDPLRRILLLSFMSLLVHQFEEYALPGGFPPVFNIAWFRETDVPDRYPLNRMSSVCVNVFLAYPGYILPIVFPKLIWLGLAQILFGMVGQLVVHGIVINRKLGSFYNPGLAVTVFLHLPIGIYYVWYVYAHRLIHPWHWIAGIGCAALGALVIVGLPVTLLRDRNSPYPFGQDEMARFHVREKLERRLRNALCPR